MSKPIITTPAKNKPDFTLILFTVAITVFIFSPTLRNGFINWDDPWYITGNKDIRNLSLESIHNFFSKYYVGNYHPLTMLSLSIDYSDPVSARSFHTTNLILHVLNTFMVFLFAFSLTKNNIIAFITALLFGLHPMHVESVAWASERKDVLYTFFFLAALCTYLKYLTDDSRKARWYILTTILFICSLLSKGQAVVLPVVLLAVDLFYGRKISIKIIKEKAPWLVLSLIFGIVAIKAQGSSDAIQNATYPFSARLFFAAYGSVAYLYKLILPIDLSCIYPYPDKLSLPFYVAPLILIILALIVWKYFRENNYVVFAFLFFLISISIVSQLIAVGGAVMAERYTYVPYLGFFMLIGKIFADAYENKFSGILRNAALVAIPFGLLAFSYITTQRVKVWKSSFTLWEDAANKNPNAQLPILNKGVAYSEEKKAYNLAIIEFNKVLQLNPNNEKAYHNRGLAYLDTKKYDEAIADFTREMDFNSKDPEVYHSRALAYYYKNDQIKAIADYDKAITISPDWAVAWYNRAVSNYSLGKFKETLNDAIKAKELGYPVEKQFIEHLRLKLNNKI